MAGVRLDMAPDEARNEKEKARGSESTLGHDWRELSAAQCPTSTHPSAREKRNPRVERDMDRHQQWQQPPVDNETKGKRRKRKLRFHVETEADRYENRGVADSSHNQVNFHRGF